MNIKKYVIGALVATSFFCTAMNAQAETILYVPQDNRPVDLLYTVSTAKDAGYTVLTPPEHIISGSDFHGDADAIWRWVDENASKADIMVLSTDSLLYGGLVDSRKHQIPLTTLEERLARIKSLKENHSTVPLYAFGTIMRSPRASGGGVEPEYYSKYGPAIFQISALQDKMDFNSGLTTAEMANLMTLMGTVPFEYLQDWFHRRNVNMSVNQMLIDYTKEHIFTYFALGHDDTSYRSQSDLESRYLRGYSKELSPKEYGSFPGADQLGLLLIARAYVDTHNLEPTFQTYYPLGGAEHTIPHYEDQTVGLTISEHIVAVGGKEITTGRPDYLLAVNTPLNTETGESEAFDNLAMPSPSLQRFVQHIKQAMDKGIAVSIADIAYSNGSDNRLLYELKKYGLLYKVDAYNGWNTASNTVGYAVAQAILGSHMTEAAHRDMLTQQYMDNWAYQANVRKQIYRMQEKIRLDNVKYDSQLSPELYSSLQEKMQTFAEKNLGIDPRTIKATFPWGRLFETGVTVYDKPIVPLEKDLIAEREKAKALAKAKEEEAKKKALEAAKNGKTESTKDEEVSEKVENTAADEHCDEQGCPLPRE